MTRFASAAVLAGLLAGPAAACINDSELPRREREFRSQYQIDTPVEPPEYRPSGSGLVAGVAVAGAALAVAGAVVSLRR